MWRETRFIKAPMKISTTGAALALLSVCALSAQVHAKPGKMMSMSVSQVDREYIIKDAQGSLSDSANAALAASRAQSNALHRYGVQLIADHARLNQILMTLARQKGVEVPVTLNDSQTTDIKELSGQSGRDFDKAIIAQFVKTNGDDVRDGRKELSVTRDPQVRRAVTQFVRTEEKHLREARALQNQIGK